MVTMHQHIDTFRRIVDTYRRLANFYTSEQRDDRVQQQLDDLVVQIEFGDLFDVNRVIREHVDMPMIFTNLGLTLFSDGIFEGAHVVALGLADGNDEAVAEVVAVLDEYRAQMDKVVTHLSGVARRIRRR
jgi:hypothetical protein